MKMTENTHNQWGKFWDDLAQKGQDDLFASSRCDFISDEVVKKIQSDIAQRLQLNSEDALLDLGCGVGIVSTTLYETVQAVTALDFGQAVLLRAKASYDNNNLDVGFAQGDIVNLPLKDGTFSKVLCYSVIHYLQNYEEFKKALLEMTRVCEPSGLVLIGDIPESNKKNSWIKGDRKKGEFIVSYWFRMLRRKSTQRNYQKSVLRFDKKRAELDIQDSNAPGMSYDADTILSICKEIGVNAQILNQPGFLPFSNTRVDLIIQK